MTREDIKDILKLRKEKKYDEIYSKYGQKVYVNIVPKSYQDMDIDKLLNAGRFLDVYEKYGEDTYEVHIKEMRKKDIENEVGVKPGFINYLFFEKCKKGLKVVRNGVLNLSIAATVASTAFVGVISAASDSKIEENSIEYESEIDEYNDEIKEYAKYINSLGLNDLEIIMKVMNDMWSTIDGYNYASEYDLLGYQRLALYYEGFGVCRNMADDFTARMNAINPEYEACNLNVYISDAELNGINRNILVSNDTVSEEENNSSDLKDDILTNMVGNHMVSCIKLKDADVLLIVDPTNPSIGVLKNGKVHMLSNVVTNGIKIKPIGNIIFGKDASNNYTEKIFESYLTNGDIDVLKEKYGLDAQNEVLDEIIENYDTDNYGIKH